MKRTYDQISEAARRAGSAIVSPTAEANQIARESSPSGAPVPPLGALPVFDVMPANSGRPVIQQELVYAGEGTIPDNLTVFDYTLPNGYVTDLQWFRCNVISVGVDEGIPPDSYILTLYLDGVAEVFNQNISVYPLDGLYPCRIIGRGGQRVTVNATFPWGASYNQVTVITCLTGQMITENRQQPQNAPLVQPGVGMKSI